MTMVKTRSASMFMVFIISLFLAAEAAAENKTFIKEFTYLASDIDSKVSSRAIALEQVKKALLEQLGTYLVSETDVKNYQLSKDQITTLTAGIVTAEIIDEMWDGRYYYLKAKMTADPNEVAKSVDLFRNDKQRSKELEDTKKKAEAALQEIEKLKNMLSTRKADVSQRTDYDQAINTITANDLFHEGFALLNAKKYKEAIRTFSRAIQLNPKSVEAYNNRGFAYSVLGLNTNAINDVNQALILDKYNTKTLLLRGNISANLNMKEKDVIDNYEQAINIDPLYADAYYYLGSYYINHSTIVLGRVSASTTKSDHKGRSNYGENYGKAVTKQDQETYNKGLANYVIAARLGHQKAQEYLRNQNRAW